MNLQICFYFYGFYSCDFQQTRVNPDHLESLQEDSFLIERFKDLEVGSEKGSYGQIGNWAQSRSFKYSFSSVGVGGPCLAFFLALSWGGWVVAWSMGQVSLGGPWLVPRVGVGGCSELLGGDWLCGSWAR